MHLGNILRNKKELAKLILVASFLAFGISSISSIFISSVDIPFWVKLSLPLVFVFFTIFYILKESFGKLEFVEEIDSVLFIDKTSNEILPVKEYPFSENLSKNMQAILLESKSFRKEWNDNPIIRKSQQEVDKSKNSNEEKVEITDKDLDKISYAMICRVDREEEDLTRFHSKLLDETITYTLLEELSLHLSSYFNDKDEDKYIFEYKRDDISKFLLKNRVLSLLTTPLEQRDIFINAFPNKISEDHGEIHALYGSDGSVYSRFDLVLPKGANIKEISSNRINIETSRVSIKIDIKYHGFGTSVPNAFIGTYLKRDPRSVVTNIVSISLKGRVKPVALFYSKGWEYHQWLDSFKSRFIEFNSYEKFLDDINWKTIESFLYANRSKKK